MSTTFRKNLKGAILLLQVEAVEDRVDNAVDAFDIHKADHRPGPSRDIDEQAFDNVRRCAIRATAVLALGWISLERAVWSGRGRLPATARESGGKLDRVPF